MTKSDRIIEIAIDDQKRLCLTPVSSTFPMIYREAMDVHWDAEKSRIYSRIPEEWSYARWFRQIVAAAKVHGVHLSLDPGARWLNVPNAIKAEITKAAANPKAHDST